MITKAGKHLVLLVVMLAAAASPGFGQSDAGGLRVLVVDGSGAVLPGADVTVTSVGTNVKEAKVSNPEGYALFTPIPRGTYVVEVTMTGFQTARVRDVSVDVQQDRLVRAVLEVGAVSETLEVTAQAAPMQTEEGSLGQVIRGTVAVELPLAGRRYTELALLVPGATHSTMNADTRGPGWFPVNGNSQTQNNFMLDGFDNNQGTQNAQSLSSQVVQPNPRRDRAVQGPDQQLLRRVRPVGRRRRQCVDQVRAPTPPRLGWYYNRDARWRRSPGTRKPAEPAEGRPVVESVRRRRRRAHRQEQLFYFGHYEGFRSDKSNFLRRLGADRRAAHRRVPVHRAGSADRAALRGQHDSAATAGSARGQDSR